MNNTENKVYEKIVAENFKAKIRSLYKTIGYHIYLLQLENYELKRYWYALKTVGYLPNSSPWRKKIVWTKKLVAITVIAVCEHLAFSVLFAYSFQFFSVPWVGFVISCFLYPYFLTISCLLLLPTDHIMKRYIVSRAQKKINCYPSLNIIGIAGSYGKTSLKEVVAAIIRYGNEILTTPENINTPLGISRLIKKKLNADVKTLIIEMGEYYRGDIAQICSITKPTIAVVTGINEAHLERLKTIKNSIATIFEVVKNSHPNALVVLNADDTLVMNNYKEYVGSRKVVFYSSHNDPHCAYAVQNKIFHQDGSGASFDLHKNSEFIGHFKTSLLGEYILGAIIGGILIADEFGLKMDDLASKISHIKPVEHRLQPLFPSNGIIVIDDSYNGNPDGVREAIRVLGEFKERRKIFLTPGLVETGASREAIHKTIGQQLASVADIVLLVKNSVTPFISDGLAATGFAPDKIMWFNTAIQAHEALKTILRPNDVILFQNDWGDNYI